MPRASDSYRVTAHFFGFVESRYPGTMKKLNAALRDHSFDNGRFWQDATGKSVEKLESDWKSDVETAVEATAATSKAEDFRGKAVNCADAPKISP